MLSWLSKDKTNAEKVKKIAVRHAVQMNIANTQLQQEREKSLMFKQFCLEVAPLRQRKENKYFCAAIVNAIVDGVLFVINNKSEGECLHCEKVSKQQIICNIRQYSQRSANEKVCKLKGHTNTSLSLM